MYRNKITCFIDFINIKYMFYISAQIPCSINRYIWIISIYFHSHMFCNIGYFYTNSSKSNNTKFFAQNFCSGIFFFLFFSCFCNIFIVCIGTNPVNSTNNITCCQKHTCNYQFFYTIGICSRCIEYYNPLTCTFIQWNIVYTCTGSCYRK